MDLKCLFARKSGRQEIWQRWRKVPFFMKTLCLLFSLTFVFWSLLALAYCIPSSWMHQNIASSSSVLDREGLYPDFHTSKTANYDNFTDARMLNEALYTKMENPFIEALESREYIEGDNQLSKLNNAVQAVGNGHLDDTPTLSYTRYWHGYLIYLKPLLCVMDIYGLRQLFQVIFFCALGLLCVQLSKMRGGAAMTVCLLVSFAIYGAAEAASCLAFFPSMCLPLFGGFFLLRLNELTKQSIFTFFAILGALIAYFDFLDNPILAWGIPAVLLVTRLTQEETCTRKDLFCLVLISFLGWAFSYCFIWGMKLLLATVFTQHNAIEDAFHQTQERLGLGDQAQYNMAISPELSIIKNLSVNEFANLVIALFVIVIIIRIAFALKNPTTYNGRISWMALACLIFIAMVPIIWFALLANHSIVHFWFTYRSLLASFFSLSAIYCILPTRSPSAD